MSVAADLFQGRSFGLIYGVNEAVLGVGSALGPWLGGFVFDVTGSYRIALLIAAWHGPRVLPIYLDGGAEKGATVNEVELRLSDQTVNHAASVDTAGGTRHP